MQPKRYSQIERALQTLDKSKVFEMLKDDHYLLFLFKKTERITAACYILTGMFSDLEPLKWKLREASSCLITSVLSFREKTVIQVQELKNEFLVAVAKTLSFFELAYVVDLVSLMNLSIVRKELEGLQQIVENKDRINLSLISRHFIGESFFGVPQDLFGASFSENKVAVDGDKASSFSEKESKVSSPRLYSVSELERFAKEHAELSKGQDAIKDTVLYEKDNLSSSAFNMRRESMGKRQQNPIKQFKQSVSGKLNDERRKLILDVIKESGSAMIKDFSEVITGCSEKTIQRRLSDLVLSGVLRKEGERRWSKYYLS